VTDDTALIVDGASPRSLTSPTAEARLAAVGDTE
jgi:hypothetical protein